MEDKLGGKYSSVLFMFMYSTVSDNELDIVLCISRPATVEVNQSTPIEIWTK